MNLSGYGLQKLNYEKLKDYEPVRRRSEVRYIPETYRRLEYYGGEQVTGLRV